MYNLVVNRRRKIKEEEEIQEAEIVTHWSAKRIGVAILILVLLVGFGIFSLSLLSKNPKILGEKTLDRPKIEIPNEKNVEEIIEKAKDELSDINAKNLIESQPRLKKIIDDLTGLTGSSTSAKNLICDSLCK